MNRTKNLSGPCAHCGVPIEFRPEEIGGVVQCPRCGRETELTLAAPTPESSVPRGLVVSAVLGILVLLLSLAITVAGLKHYQKKLQDKRAGAPAPAAGRQ